MLTSKNPNRERHRRLMASLFRKNIGKPTRPGIHIDHSRACEAEVQPNENTTCAIASSYMQTNETRGREYARRQRANRQNRRMHRRQVRYNLAVLTAAARDDELHELNSKYDSVSDLLCFCMAALKFNERRHPGQCKHNSKKPFMSTKASGEGSPLPRSSFPFVISEEDDIDFVLDDLLNRSNRCNILLDPCHGCMTWSELCSREIVPFTYMFEAHGSFHDTGIEGRAASLESLHVHGSGDISEEPFNSYGGGSRYPCYTNQCFIDACHAHGIPVEIEDGPHWALADGTRLLAPFGFFIQPCAPDEVRAEGRYIAYNGFHFVPFFGAGHALRTLYHFFHQGFGVDDSRPNSPSGAHVIVATALYAPTAETAIFEIIQFSAGTRFGTECRCETNEDDRLGGMQAPATSSSTMHVPAAVDAATSLANGVDDCQDISNLVRGYMSSSIQRERMIPTTTDINRNSILALTANRYELVDLHMPQAARVLKQLTVAVLSYYRKSFSAGEITVRDYVEALHLAEGDLYLRAHKASIYNYDDGAWQLYRGLISEAVLGRCRTFFTHVQGMMLKLHASNASRASDEAVVKASRDMLVAEQAPTLQGLLRVLEEAHLTTPVQDSPASDDGDVADPPWIKVKTGVWKLSNSLQKELLSKQIFVYYAEWCSTAMKIQPGICFKDACLLFTDTGIMYVSKHPLHNVYIHIPLNLKDPLEDEAMRDVAQFYAQTFWKNQLALKCCFSAFCYALHYKNVDRAFQTIAPGGVGQSIFSAHLAAMVPGLHAYLDTNVYYDDGEMRKQMDNLIDKLICTLQEVYEGKGTGFRFDLLKKHITAEAIAGRPPYGIITRMIELIGWKRIESNKVLKIPGVDESNFESVLRRFLIIVLRARFVDAATLATLQNPSDNGIFLKDPNLKDRLTSGSRIVAGWKVMHGFMRAYNAQQAYDLIESYVNGRDGGLTRSCLRQACSLPAETSHAMNPMNAIRFDPIAAERQRLQKMSDDLAIWCLANNHETMSDALCRLATVLPGKNFQERKSDLKSLVNAGMWKKSVRLAGNSGDAYIPLIRTRGKLSDLFPLRPASPLLVFQEALDARALDRSLNAHPARKHNAERLARFYSDTAETLAARPGRLSELMTRCLDEYREKGRKMCLHETAAHKLNERLKHEAALIAEADSQASENIVLLLQNMYSTKYPRRSRRRVDGLGVQGLSNSHVRSMLPNTDEWDDTAAMFTYISQIVDRLDIQLGSPVADCHAFKKYLSERESIHTTISLDEGYAKRLCQSVANGSRIPEELKDNDFLSCLRTEARLLRWVSVSLDPEFHSKLLEEPNRTWPENTCFFYMWTGVEDWVTEVKSAYIQSLKPMHMSLHFDAVRTSCEIYASNEDDFRNKMMEVVRVQTGYNVNIRKKQKEHVVDFIERTAVLSEQYEVPDILTQPGNCIPASFVEAGLPVEHVMSILSKRTQANIDARRTGVRSYYECLLRFGIDLHPAFFSDLVDGAYSVLLEKDGEPFAITFIRRSTEDCDWRFEGKVYKQDFRAIQQGWSSCIGSKHAVFYRVTEKGKEQEDRSLHSLLHLQAGGRHNVPGCERSPTIAKNLPIGLQCALSKELNFLKTNITARGNKNEFFVEGVWQCPLCPCKILCSKDKMVAHYMRAHYAKLNGTASTKQLRLVQAKWNADISAAMSTNILGSREPDHGNFSYLRWSAVTMRNSLHPTSMQAGKKSAAGRRIGDRTSGHLDEHIVLLLDNKNTRYIRKSDASAFHRIGHHTCSTDAFISTFLASILHPETKGSMARAVERLREKSGIMGHLLPTNNDLCKTLWEDVLSHPKISECIDRCKATADLTVLTIDGQYGPLLNTLYQIPFGTKGKDIRRQLGDLHVMLTVVCSNMVVHVEPQPWEMDANALMRILVRACGLLGTRFTRLVMSDSPDVLDIRAIYVRFPFLECIAGDPIHIVLRVEKAFGEMRSNLSSGLRVCMNKLRMGLDDGREYFTFNCTVPKHPTLQDVMKQLDRTKVSAIVKRIHGQSGATVRPYRSVQAFQADVASLAVHYEKQVNRNARGKKISVLTSLCDSLCPRNLEYILNYTRFVARNPSVDIPYGTTSNEAFHNELKGFFRNIRTPTRRLVQILARLVTVVKLIAGSLEEQDLTRTKHSQSDKLRSFCKHLEAEPLEFRPLLRVMTRRERPNVKKVDRRAKGVARPHGFKGGKVGWLARHINVALRLQQLNVTHETIISTYEKMIGESVLPLCNARHLCAAAVGHDITCTYAYAFVTGL